MVDFGPPRERPVVVDPAQELGVLGKRADVAVLDIGFAVGEAIQYLIDGLDAVKVERGLVFATEP
jgi:hypothetical protein